MRLGVLYLNGVKPNKILDDDGGLRSSAKFGKALCLRT